MEKNQKMTYLAIPDEACYIVDMDGNDVFDINDVAENTTCICFKDDDASHVNKISSLLAGIKNMYMKTAWFTKRVSIPYKAELFDYVKTGDTLYMNITDSKYPKYADITNKIVNDETMLDPMAIFYFDMFEEFKNLKK